MNLADHMLLAQLRQSALKDVPADQWAMIEVAVEQAGGVRATSGYAGTVLTKAIQTVFKASFGGDRSAAGRYAAEQRWKNHVSAARRRELAAKYPNAGGVVDVPAPARTREQRDRVAANVQAAQLRGKSLSEIADAIRADLKATGQKVPFGAGPYLDALGALQDINDDYGADSGKMIVAYLLSNLRGYKGEQAKAIKAELNRRLKSPDASREAGQLQNVTSEQPRGEGAEYQRTKNLPLKEVAKLIRTDMKAVQETFQRNTGLPLKVSVRTNTKGTGYSINVELELPKDLNDLYREYLRDRGNYRGDQTSGYGLSGTKYQRLIPVRAALDAAEEAHAKYNYNNSDPFTDYFDVRYYGVPSIRVDYSSSTAENRSSNRPLLPIPGAGQYGIGRLAGYVASGRYREDRKRATARRKKK